MTWSHQLHMLLSSCGPFGVVPDGVCGALGGIANWTQDAAEAIQNPFRWLYHHTLGSPMPQQPGDAGWDACRADWTQPACPKLIDQLKPSHIPLAGTWPNVYSAFAVSGVFIAATCCVVRVVRSLFDERIAGINLVTDNVLRMVVATGVLLSPTPDHSFLLNAMTWSAAASGHVATSAAAATASALGIRLDLADAVGAVATLGFANGGIGDFLVAIPILLAAVALLYVTALYLLRVIQLVFAVATAPIFVALAVYEPRSRFVHWWIDLFTSAMVLPLLLGVFGALTAGVALQFLGGHAGVASTGGGIESVTRILLACFAILGGAWMTGKAVHGLAWRGFSHGGITGAVTAVSTSVMALPNLAGNVGSAVRAAGRVTGGGGTVQRLRASRPSPDPLLQDTDYMSPTEAAVAAAAAGHLSGSDAPHSNSAGLDRSVPVGDFAAQPATAALLKSPAARDAFNRVLSTAVVGYATSTEGLPAVQLATAHLDATGTTQADRVEHYTQLLARDPVVGNALSSAAIASLLHDQAPEVSSILEIQPQRMPT